ncbi:hypothetical protein YC2023_057769 [Brassica napus]
MVSQTTECCRVRSKIESGERPARECACRRRSLSNYRAAVWRFGAVKLVVLSVDVSFPGGGDSYSSVAAGPCLREVETSSALPSSVLSLGGEDSLSLTSPALGVSVRWIGFGSPL